GIRLDPAALPLPGILAEAARALRARRKDAGREGIAREGAGRKDLMGEEAGRMDADVLAWVLTGGDAHARAATFPAHVRLPSEWTRIGEVTGGEGVQVTGHIIPATGWDHFRR